MRTKFSVKSQANLPAMSYRLRDNTSVHIFFIYFVIVVSLYQGKFLRIFLDKM